MVVSNAFDFYSPALNNNPMDSESKQHIAAPSYNSCTDIKKEGMAVSDIPLSDALAEKPIVRATTAPLRRSQELARPRRKPKPRPFDRFVQICSNQSLVVKGAIIAVVTSIPFIIFEIVAYEAFPPETLVGPKQLSTTLRRLANWLLLCWGSFIGLLYLGRVVAMSVAWLCTLSTAANRFRGLAREACLRITLFLWAAVGYAVIPRILGSNTAEHPDVVKAVDDWIAKLHKAFMFLMIAFAIILVQGIILMLIKIQYIEGFIGPRAERASNELEVIKDLNNLVSPHLSADDIGVVARALKKLLMPVNPNDLYYIISRGEGDVEKWSDYAAMIWQTISGGKEYLTAEDLPRQLQTMNRDPARGRDLFLQLDESLDGQITEDEVIKLVHRIGVQLNRRTQSMNGIRHLMQKLEIVLSILVLGLIVFLYVQFFEKDLAKNIGNLWTGIVGLAFAFSGAVSEFVNSTVFVFGKHAYDVGDFVEVKAKKYIVSRIFLTHTNFEQVQNEDVRGLFTQMSHASLASEPIVNWTRTVEEAARRHAKSDADAGKKTGAREDNVAALVVQKLEHLKMVDGVSKQE